ncbi:uncharacterized protein AMSG_10656 [Thecamonas trahens ATCC 50062]|uniref:HEAT repeat-containing protein 1 n=1 Tax=Thecamonas trahens ATCC 50062 TaxID=461836 RepID=A0A0L0DS20_THETB|nr:hypothetical protein AMSG_10656 [Thecamonas trahens ATCC 50062]KNC55060.1 hypothetical protein AMSG_10656 [Thecamonas trahens ATCC 50062]|eukprot:XP_013753364.1 hypothetical protein AMSG_10656 [Thecamonas trahens ATCC 50062]
MSSNLAKQLKALRPRDLHSREGKSGVPVYTSFLFTMRQAADVDLASLHFLATNGLAALVRIEPRLAKFEAVLFPRELTPLRRSLLTQEQADELDGHLEEFIALTAPYFLLKSTGKVLEFLIRRYSIHTHNVAALVGAYLPYHATPLFARLVMVLNLGGSSGSAGNLTSAASPLRLHHASLDFAWLVGVKRSGVPLQRANLLKWLVKDLATLNWIASAVTHVLSFVPDWSIGASFFLSLLSGIAGSSQRLSERKLGVLLPSVVTAATSAVPDLQLAAFMLLAQISARTTLALTVLEPFLTLLAAAVPSAHARYAMHTLAVVCGTQGVRRLPLDATRALLHADRAIGAGSVATHLVAIASASGGSLELATALAFPLLASCVDVYAAALTNAMPDAADLASQITPLLSDVASLFPALSSAATTSLLDPLFDALAAAPPSAVAPKLATDLTAVISLFSLRFGSAFELALDAAMARARSSDAAAPQTLSAWLDLAMPSSLRVSQVGSGSLYYALNSGSTSLRVDALVQLADLLTTDDRLADLLAADDDSPDAKERAFVQDTLRSALADPEPSIVAAALAAAPITALVPITELVATIAALLASPPSAWSSADTRSVVVAALAALADSASRLAPDALVELESEDESQGTLLVAFQLVAAHLAATTKSPASFSAALAAAMALADAGALPEFAGLTTHASLRKAAKSPPKVADSAALDDVYAVLLAGLASGLADSPRLAATLSSAASGVASPLAWSALPLLLAASIVTLERTRLALLSADSPAEAAALPRPHLATTLLPQVLALVRETVTPNLALASLDALTEDDLPRGSATGRLGALVRTALASHRSGWRKARALLAASVLRAVAEVADGPSLAPIFVVVCATLPPRLHLVLVAVLLTRAAPSGALADALPFLHAPLQLPSLVGIDPRASRSSLQLVHIRAVNHVLALLQAPAAAAGLVSAKFSPKSPSLLSGLVAHLLIAAASAFAPVRSLAVSAFAAVAAAIAKPPAGAAVTAKQAKALAPIAALADAVIARSGEIAADGGVLGRIFADAAANTVAKSAGKKGRKTAEARLKAWITTLFSAMLGSQPAVAHPVAQAVLVRIMIASRSSLVYASGGSKLLGQLAGKASQNTEWDASSELLLVESLDMLGAPGVPQLLGSDPEPFVTLFSAASSAAVVAAAVNVLSQQVLDELPSDSQRVAVVHALIIANSRAKAGQLDAADAHIVVPRAILALLHSLVLSAPLLEALMRAAERSAADASTALDTLDGDDDAAESSARKRSRRSADAEPGHAEAQLSQPAGSWRVVTLAKVLEWIFEIRGVSGFSHLVPVLFHHLSSLLSSSSASSASSGASFDGEYTKQLLLRALRLSLEQDEVVGDEAALSALAQYFDIQIVVAVLRSQSSSPATHTHALQLLAKLARIVPERVLHTIMPVFAFMGSSAVKRDDAYTYSVIEATLRQVLPPLLEVGLDASGILVIFGDAFGYIPQHRQRFLYRVLVETIGGSALTFLALYFVLKATSGSGDEAGAFWDMTSALLLEFHPLTALNSLAQVLDVVHALPSTKAEYNSARMAAEAEADDDAAALHRGEVAMVGGGSAAFDYTKHSFDDGLALKLGMTRFVGEFVALDEFLEALVDVVDSAEARDLSRDELEAALQALYRSLFGRGLELVHQARSGTKAGDKALAVTWSELYGRAVNVLDQLNSLLSVEQFLEVTSALFASDDVLIQQSALELFNAKIEREKGEFTSDEQASFVATVPQLGELISQSTSESAVQNALFSLSIVTRAFGHVSREAFGEVLPLVVGQLTGEAGSSGGVHMSALLCVASLTATLGVKVLAQVPVLLPWLVAALQAGPDAVAEPAMAKHFQEALLTAVEMVVAQLHAFLNPYLIPLLTALTSDYHLGSSKGVRVLRVFGKQVPPRQLIPALFAAFARADSPAAAVAILEVLGVALEHMPKKRVFEVAPDVFDFVLDASDAPALADDTREGLLATLVRLVLRLNEKTFKPLFVKLCTWAERGARTETFLSFLAALAGALKSIFVPYVPSFMAVVVEVLKRGNDADADADEASRGKKRRKTAAKAKAVVHSSGDTSSARELELALRLLKRVFRYDADGMMNRERYNELYPLLVALVPRVASERGDVHRLFVDAVGELMVCVSNDAWWKPFNFELLMQTRSPNPAIRLVVVEVLIRLYALLESDYLILLPETVPFLAELTEDDDSDVERKTAELVKMIEAVLGHSLSKYW